MTNSNVFNMSFYKKDNRMYYDETVREYFTMPQTVTRNGKQVLISEINKTRKINQN